MIDEIAARFPFWGNGALIAVGLYGMIGKRSLVKKLIGMNIFQSAIILFFVAGSVQDGATLPILFESGHGDARYINPLPHVLMLTAIVVGIATTGSRWRSSSGYDASSGVRTKRPSSSRCGHSRSTPHSHTAAAAAARGGGPVSGETAPRTRLPRNAGRRPGLRRRVGLGAGPSRANGGVRSTTTWAAGRRRWESST